MPNPQMNHDVPVAPAPFIAWSNTLNGIKYRAVIVYPATPNLKGSIVLEKNVRTDSMSVQMWDIVKLADMPNEFLEELVKYSNSSGSIMHQRPS